MISCLSTSSSSGTSLWKQSAEEVKVDAWWWHQLLVAGLAISNPKSQSIGNRFLRPLKQEKKRLTTMAR
jgi:hypothetical protein